MLGLSGELIALIAVAGVGGWVLTTWLRIKNGYPLDGAWGQAMHPKGNPKDADRMRLLTQENARLQAEVGSVKDRLANVERIVTDTGYGLSGEIEKLRSDIGESGSGVPLDTRQSEGQH